MKREREREREREVPSKAIGSSAARAENPIP